MKSGRKIRIGRSGLLEWGYQKMRGELKNPLPLEELFRSEFPALESLGLSRLIVGDRGEPAQLREPWHGAHRRGSIASSNCFRT